MEPFALESPKKPRAPWIIAAVCALLFGIWQFDLLPHIVPVQTGELPAESSPPFVGDSRPEGMPWDEIVDLKHRLPSEQSDGVQTTDPVLAALAARQEPLDLRLTEPSESESETLAAVPERPQRDTAVRPASFEISADAVQDHEETVEATVIPAELAQRLREIDQLYRDDYILDAHAELSKIYWREPALRALIRARLEHTSSLIYTSGERQFDDPWLVQPGDTLSAIAAQFQVPWQYLARLNRTSPERFQAGQQLKVIQGPFSAVVDLDEFALTVHAHGWFVHRYRIGTGKDQKTPTGEFVVREKLEDPTWFDPDGGQIEPGDPENPLGKYWLGLGNQIGIHGTNDPDSIGRAKSRGCIHLADSDIDEVFHLLGVGSKVLIRR